jgi:TPR repeat protein
MYWHGEGRCEEDDGKAVYHFEQAAIGGDPQARHDLGCHEELNGRSDRAVKHFIIAANLGYEASMKALLEAYKDGRITKDEYGSTLRTHQAAIEATKSSQREAAERAGF